MNRLEEIVRADTNLMWLLERARSIGLPQWRLVAGCLYQTVWNVLTGRPNGTGIRDYDLIYFNPGDLSWAAEDRIIRSVAEATMTCVGPVEVRNQARVHLWFKDRFGSSYPQVSSADEALTRYVSIAHAVGVRLEVNDRLDICAPFGLDDLFNMVIRPNYAFDNSLSFSTKAQRTKAIWPEVTIVPWQSATP